MRAPAEKKQSILFLLFGGQPILIKMSSKPFAERLLAAIAAERERREPPADFPDLPPVPVGRYRDPAFLALEGERLWPSSWLYAAHLDELPAPGSYRLWHRLGAPVIILRHPDGEPRAFFNACRHRGGPLVAAGRGHLDMRMRCRYHGWTYDLDGQLCGVRDRRDFPQLDRADGRLAALRCERFGNWVFVNADPDAEPLRNYLGPVGDYLERLDLDALRLVHRETLEINCNFKILLEGFLEVYHLGNVHPGTVDRFLDYRATLMLLWPRGHSCMLTANRSRDWQDPGARGMPEIGGATELERHNNPSLHLFPNLVTPVSATGMPFNLLWPLSETRSLLEVLWFAPGWGDGERPALWERRIANYNRILHEDIDLVERIQDNLRSPGIRDPLLGYPERRIYYWHEELDRRIGRERIPPALQVSPRLAAMVTEGWP